MRLLLTGATGKVGQAFLEAFLSDARFADWTLVAICNNRMVQEHPRITTIKGSIADRDTVQSAMNGVTHVLHMAAVKESPDLVIDVAIKGMFTLLEECRTMPDFQQFILIGGDCSVGHIFHDYGAPITEDAPRRAYPGCYALTKVLEEVMLEQYQIQYGLNGCILRAPWIMEKDDFRFALSFGPDQFGGPDWTDLIPAEAVAAHHAAGRVPVMLDNEGRGLRRNFVHVNDLVSAILAALDNPAARQQTFNIAMTEPVDYRRVGDLLRDRHGMDPVDIATPYYSNHLDNSKARLRLDWAPVVDLSALIDMAWSYERAPDDPRKIWYPG